MTWSALVAAELFVVVSFVLGFWMGWRERSKDAPQDRHEGWMAGHKAAHDAWLKWAKQRKEDR